MVIAVIHFLSPHDFAVDVSLTLEYGGGKKLSGADANDQTFTSLPGDFDAAAAFITVSNRFQQMATRDTE